MTRKFHVVAGMVLGALLAVALLTGAGRLLASTLASDPAPEIVNYQGYLTNSSGDPISGTVSLEFKIYDASSGGTELWAETHPSVPVSSGYFSVFLGGEGTPLTPSVFSGTTRYLQVTYNGTTFARQRFASVPYALVSYQATKAISSTYATTATYALNAPSSGSGVEWQYVKVVAKSGGDYTSITEAMNAITPTSSSRYLVLVMPGVYEEQVTLKPYVHLKGAGTKSTIIHIAATDTNATDPGAYVLYIPANSQVSDLAVINSGATNSSVGVRVENGNTETLLDNVSVAVTGTTGTNHYAILARTGNGSPTFHHVYAKAAGATQNNAGLYINAVKPILDDSAFYAETGNFAWGVRFVGGEATIRDTIMSGTNGASGVGLSTSNPSGIQNIKIDRSTASGETGVQNVENYFVYIGASQIGGGVSGAGIVCAQSYNENYVELQANCAP